MKKMCWTAGQVVHILHKRSCFSVVHILHKRSCFSFKDRHRLQGELLTLLLSVSEITRCQRKRLMSPEASKRACYACELLYIAFCKCEEQAILQRSKDTWKSRRKGLETLNKTKDPKISVNIVNFLFCFIECLQPFPFCFFFHTLQFFFLNVQDVVKNWKSRCLVMATRDKYGLNVRTHRWWIGRRGWPFQANWEVRA
jgi:hypothetical protein